MYHVRELHILLTISEADRGHLSQQSWHSF